MKKIRFALVWFLILVALCSCSRSGYINSYSASIMRSSCLGNKGSIEFSSFKGTYHFKLKAKDTSAHTLDLEAKLGEGEIRVYVGVDGEKDLIRTVKGGESYDETITLDSKYDDEKTIYVILESKDKCTDGDFQFAYH